MKNTSPAAVTSHTDREPTTITATQLARSLSDVLSRVHYQGERFVVKRNGETVATLEPPEPRTEATLRDLVAFVMSQPTPDDTFADDLEAIHAAQPPAEFPEWPS